MAEGKELTSMNNVHGAHGSAGIVEDVFFFEIEMGLDAVDGGELGDDARDYGLGVVAMFIDGVEGDLVELGWIEDVEAFEVCFENCVDCVRNCEE